MGRWRSSPARKVFRPLKFFHFCADLNLILILERRFPEAVVDPRVLPEHDGWPATPAKNEDGISYLRRLKGGSGAASSSAAIKNEAQPTQQCGDWKDRRQSPRLRCSGSAEFRTRGSAVHMWGTLTDISLHGCYVEMNNTFPVGTRVELVLKSCGIRIEVAGTIRVSYPSLGMGIGFVDIEAEQQAALEQLLAALGGQSAFFRGVRSQPYDELTETVRTVDARALVNEVTDFLRKNQQLSRDEFHKIAKRVRRS